MSNKNISFQEALAEYKEHSDLIPLLQAAQKEYSYISAGIMEKISAHTGISLSDIYGVVTFYRQFRLTEPGMFTIKVCDGTACHVNDSTKIIDTLKELLNTDVDETTEDGYFTLTTVSCLGCCSLAPAMMIDQKVFGRLTTDSIKKILDEYRTNTSVMNILREDR